MPTTAVVTLLVSVDGGHNQKIPAISSRADLEDALLRIAADSRADDCRLMSGEVLWTPEDAASTLSDRDVASSYPHLVVL